MRNLFLFLYIVFFVGCYGPKLPVVDKCESLDEINKSLCYGKDYVSRNQPEQAKMYFEKCVDLSYKKPYEKSICFYNLGLLYENNFKNILYLDYYKKSAELGNTKSMIKLGNYHEKKKDIDLSRHWYLSSYRSGDFSALLFLGDLEYKNKNINQALINYEKLSKEHNISSGYSRISEIYQEKKDYQKAINYLILASKLGDVKSLRTSGKIYEYFLKNNKKAIEQYTACFERGESDCAINIAFIYKQKKETRKLAHDWYDKAIELGNAKAMYSLGFMYEDIYKNYNEAEKWYKKSISSGNNMGAFALGCLYEEVYKDYPSAIKWYELGVSMGNEDAAFNLGYLYYKTLKNITKAIEWYRKAADMGNDNALIYLYDLDKI